MNLISEAQHQSILANAGLIASPSLLVIEPLVDRNLQTMMAMVNGHASRLRPHLKTTKSPEIVRKMLALGIQQFKCATLAELLMALKAGASDILLAYQPVGPNIRKLAAIAQEHPTASIACLIDDPSIARQVSEAAKQLKVSLHCWIDVDCGMHRSGIAAGPEAEALHALINQLPGLSFSGLHVYDGHIRDTDRQKRATNCHQAFKSVWTLAKSLQLEDLQVIAGGTPTFAVHASDRRVVCSPGTSVYWDVGYATIVPDLDFACAAYLLTRVVSKPTSGHLCLDLGHKAVAAEGPLETRVAFPVLPQAQLVGQSEEHLVVATPDAERWPVGTPFLAVPWHICPSVALYDEAIVIKEEHACGTWPITARDRRWS